MEPPAPRDVPAEVQHVLQLLWSNGQAAYLVGGCVRDGLLDRPIGDWDVATDALPERTMSLFPGSSYTNRFGTVTVPPAVEVTTFRRDHQYADHRRPDSVTFTDSLDEDLARRDFTVNAIAWGRGRSTDGDQPRWVDPTDGLADMRTGTLRAVGEAEVRFDEDALRLLRAARLAAQLSFVIEPRTLAAMAVTAEIARWISAERIGGELRRMLTADPPSRGLAILADTGVLNFALPELAAQIGVPQDKVPGRDLWDHCLIALDAAAGIDAGNERLMLATLLHDIGKPLTFADGHFIGHDTAGAELAESLLARVAYPRREAGEVAALIRNHMFSYERRWSGAAVRRFIRRIGRELIPDLLNLRRADNIGSGLPAGAGHVDELEARVAGELDSGVPLTLGELAVDGDDLISNLGIAPGPLVGELLERLLGSVISDPARNDRERLLAEARAWAARAAREGATAR